MTATGRDDDRVVVEAAQAGDRLALDRLLRDHQATIHAICRRITGNDADALDATQEALIAVVRGLPRFDGRARFSTWVYRVATNACLDELRRMRRRPLVGLPGIHEREGNDAIADPPDETAGSFADDIGERLAVDAALQQLAPEFRAAVVLRDLCQLDYAEIAEVLEIPAGTVRSRIARGRAQLADRLGNQTDLAQRRSPSP